MATTLLQLRTETYGILNDLTTSNVFSSDFIDQTINDQQVELCDSKKWQFLRAKKIFLVPVDTTTTAAVATSDVTISLANVDNFESAGSVWIDHDVIDYTAISTLDLTGVTGIDIAHSSGDTVYPLIAVPTDYANTPQLKVRKSTGEHYDEVLFTDERLWDDEIGGGNYAAKFTIIHSEDDGNLHIRMDGLSSGDRAVFYYMKSPTTMSDDADTATIPDPYALKILPKLAAYKAMKLRGDNLDGLGDMIQQEAMVETMAMHKHYGQRDEGIAPMVKNRYNSNYGRYRLRKHIRI